MKYITVAVLAFSLQFSTSTQSASREECLPIEGLAESIMRSRQSGESMSEIMNAYKYSETAQYLTVKAFDNHIKARNENVQKDIVESFKNYAFLKCIKDDLKIDFIAQVDQPVVAVDIDSLVSAEVSGKSSSPIDMMESGNSIAIDIVYKNNASKSLVRFDGKIIITSISGAHLLDFDVTVDGDIPKGSDEFRRGNLIPYTGVTQKPFLLTDKSALKTKLVLQSVLFSDGTIMQR